MCTRVNSHWAGTVAKLAGNFRWGRLALAQRRRVQERHRPSARVAGPPPRQAHLRVPARGARRCAHLTARPVQARHARGPPPPPARRGADEAGRRGR